MIAGTRSQHLADDGGVSGWNGTAQLFINRLTRLAYASLFFNKDSHLHITTIQSAIVEYSYAATMLLDFLLCIGTYFETDIPKQKKES